MSVSNAANRDSLPRLSSRLTKAMRLFALTGLGFALTAATLTPEQAAWYRARLRIAGTVAPTQATTTVNPLAEAILTWDRLRQSDNLTFPEYAAFLRDHPGWPGEAAMRRAAERGLKPDLISPSEVAAHFTRYPPLTTSGALRHAEALLALGRTDQARAEARTAWTGGLLSNDDEIRLLGRFAANLTPADHDARMDALLWNAGTASLTTAQRQLMFTSAAKRPYYQARLALRLRWPDADSQTQAIWPQYRSDPGLLAARAAWMRDTANSLGARQLLADADVAAGTAGSPLEWMRTSLTFAQGAANDKQWDLAYRIADHVRPLPAGQSMRDRPLGERDLYTSLEWLAGWTALRQLGRPADAVQHFRNYSAAAQSPQTQSKGDYWAGRAAEAAGQAQAARAAYEEAASHPDHFYGQLAIERLGRPLALSPALLAAPTPAQRATFEASEPVRAARLLAELGDRDRQGIFLRALALDAASPESQTLVADLGIALGRPEVGVQVAREARRLNGIGMLDASYPKLSFPAMFDRMWTMIHAITRQESMFARDAVSRTGARGLMQLMPGTARETSAKVGQSYNLGRLTTDTDYNILLGSTYYANLLDRYGGNHVLAVAAYNAGPGNVNKWLAANGDPRQPGVDVIDWIEAIPFSETRGYVQRVLENAVVYDTLNPTRAKMPASNRLSAYLGKRNPG